MLIAIGKGSERTVLVIGLSATNISRLQDNQPIRVNLRDYGVENMELMIWAGTTELEMAGEWREMLGPDTKVHIDPRLFGGHD